MIFEDKPPTIHMDKLCCLALAGLLTATAVVYEMTDGAALRAAEMAKPETGITVTAPTIDFIPLLEAAEARIGDRYDESIPLDQVCQEVLWKACEDSNVPICDALGVIYIESRFDPEADNGLSYGYMGLNRKYFPSNLTPAENIQAGVAYLGELLEKYGGDTQAALRSYNLGHDDGDRVYARAVLQASEKWGNG